MTATKTIELLNFRRLMGEVQRHDTTPEAAAGMIDEYVASEVARRINSQQLIVSRQPDVELGLHPLGTVQDCADRLARDHERGADRMVLVLLREYAMLRRRMADARLRALTHGVPVKPLKNAEQQLFDSLRELGQAQEDPPPQRRKDDQQ